MDLDCRPQLRGCAYSNVVGLLGALLAFCLYCFSLSTERNEEPCVPTYSDYAYRPSVYGCPGELLTVSHQTFPEVNKRENKNR